MKINGNTTKELKDRKHSLIVNTFIGNEEMEEKEMEEKIAKEKEKIAKETKKTEVIEGFNSTVKKQGKNFILTTFVKLSEKISEEINKIKEKVNKDGESLKIVLNTRTGDIAIPKIVATKLQNIEILKILGEKPAISLDAEGKNFEIFGEMVKYKKEEEEKLFFSSTIVSSENKKDVKKIKEIIENMGYEPKIEKYKDKDGNKKFSLKLTIFPTASKEDLKEMIKNIDKKQFGVFKLSVNSLNEYIKNFKPIVKEQKQEEQEEKTKEKSKKKKKGKEKKKDKEKIQDKIPF